jgi:hypothetical protein
MNLERFDEKWGTEECPEQKPEKRVPRLMCPRSILDRLHLVIKLPRCLLTLAPALIVESFLVSLFLQICQCFAVGDLRADPPPPSQPWATVGMVRALAQPELQESALRLVSEVPFLFDSKDHKLQEAMRVAVIRLTEAPAPRDDKMLLALIQKFDIGIPNLSSWLHSAIANLDSFDSRKDAFGMLAARKIITQADRDEVRNQLLSERLSLATDFAKRCEFLRSIGALLPEDLVQLRQRITNADQTGDKLQALDILCQIDHLSDSEMSLVRSVIHSSIFGQWDKRTALKIIVASGRADTKDVQDLWPLLLEGVVFPIEPDAQRLAGIEGGPETLRRAFALADRSPELKGKLLYTLAELKIIEPSEIAQAEVLLRSTDPAVFKAALGTLKVAGALSENHRPELRKHLAGASTEDRVWIIRLLQELHPLDSFETDYLFDLLTAKDEFIQLQAVDLLMKSDNASDPRVAANLKRLVASGEHALPAYAHLIKLKAVSSQDAEDLRAARKGNFDRSFMALDLLRQSNYATASDLAAVIDAFVPTIWSFTNTGIAVLIANRDLAGNSMAKLAALVSESHNGIDDISMTREALNPRIRLPLLALGPFDLVTIEILLNKAIVEQHAARDLCLLALVGSGADESRAKAICSVLSGKAESSDYLTSIAQLTSLNLLWPEEENLMPLKSRLADMARELVRGLKTWPDKIDVVLNIWRSRIPDLLPIAVIPSNSPIDPVPNGPHADPWWIRYVVGAFLTLVAVGFAIWGFLAVELSEDRRRILVWVLPLCSGFAAFAFAGSLSVSSKEFWPGVAIAATGGFGVWLLTFFFLFPAARSRK